jgi:hypothetical protein
MATILTGRSLTLTIDGDAWTNQAVRAELVPNQTANQYITLGDTGATLDPATFTLEVEAMQDWPDASSLFEALWTAATAGTAIAFTLAVAGAGSFTGNVLPVFPNAGGSADAALTSTLSFPLIGQATYTP